MVDLTETLPGLPDPTEGLRMRKCFFRFSNVKISGLVRHIFMCPNMLLFCLYPQDAQFYTRNMHYSGISLVVGKIHWQIESTLMQIIRKLVMSGSGTGTYSRGSVSKMAASLRGAQGAIREV